MEDGAILLWDATEVMEARGEQMNGCKFASQIHGSESHACPVNALNFNPHKQNLLASAGSRVFIQDLSSGMD